MYDDVLYLSKKYDELRKEYKNLLSSRELYIGNILYQCRLVRFLYDAIRGKISSNEINTNKLLLIKDDLNWKPKVAVYQAIIGYYDTINAVFPLYHEIYDYYLFTDIKQGNIYNGWTVKEIPNNIKELNNPILINRYLKMHPYEFFKEYDYTVYIDGNINIVSDIRPMLRQVSNVTGLAIHRHSRRNCVYDEMRSCIKSKKGVPKLLLKQIERYKQLGLPKKIGLYECSLIIADLKNKMGENILTSWWEEFLFSGSLRDQLALPYVIWASGCSFDSIGEFGCSIQQNPKLLWMNHRAQ
jgi:hypothetical protein